MSLIPHAVAVSLSHVAMFACICFSSICSLVNVTAFSCQSGVMYDAVVPRYASLEMLDQISVVRLTACAAAISSATVLASSDFWLLRRSHDKESCTVAQGTISSTKASFSTRDSGSMFATIQHTKSAVIFSCRLSLHGCCAPTPNVPSDGRVVLASVPTPDIDGCIARR